MTTTDIDRKALLAVVAELNEKRDAGIQNPTKCSTQKLFEKISAATEHGTDLKKLNKAARATILAMFASTLAAAPEDAPAKPADKPAAEKKGGAKDAADKPAENDAAQEESPEDSQTDTESDQDQGNSPEMDLLSREALNLAAHDMNEAMGLDPGIDTSLEDDELFRKSFVKAAGIVQSTDNFKDFTWAVLQANNLGPERALTTPVVAEKPAKVKGAKAAKPEKPASKSKADKAPAKPADKPAAEKKGGAKDAADKPAKGAAKAENAPKTGTKKAKGERGTGIIATIQMLLDEYAASKKAFTRLDLHARLLKQFPNRDEDALLSTIRTQVPGRMNRERGYQFTKEGDLFKVTAPKK